MLADTYDRVTYLTKRIAEDAPDDYTAFGHTVIALVWLLDEAAGAELYRQWEKDYDDYYTPDQLGDEVWKILRNNDLKHTPWDKFLPWVYRELRTSNHDIHDVVELLQDLPEWQRATKADVGRLTFAQVALAMSIWRAADTVKRIAHRFANGWYVLRLWRRKELEDEGEQMDHCVGGLEWYQEVRAGTKAIYSLRDPDGAPHVTLEWDPRALKFVQMMMHGDAHPPSAPYRDMLAEFVRAVPGKRPAEHLVADLLLAGIPARDLDWRGVDARGWDLAGADLSGANLSGADLARANLLNAKLQDAQLRGTGLEGAILYGAYLTSADLRGARLTDANLRDARLVGAQVEAAALRGAHLNHATILPDGRPACAAQDEVRGTCPASAQAELGRRRR